MQAGISTKAYSHLSPNDIDDIIVEFFENYVVLSQNPSDELTSRYLLACGEAMGGKMRNIIGKLAEEVVVGKIFANLRIRHRQAFAFVKRLNSWLSIEHVNQDDYIDVCPRKLAGSWKTQARVCGSSTI